MTDTQEGWTTEEVDAAWVEEVDEGWAEWEGDYEYVRQGRVAAQGRGHLPVRHRFSSGSARRRRPLAVGRAPDQPSRRSGRQAHRDDRSGSDHLRDRRPARDPWRDHERSSLPLVRELQEGRPVLAGLLRAAQALVDGRRGQGARHAAADHVHERDVPRGLHAQQVRGSGSRRRCRVCPPTSSWHGGQLGAAAIEVRARRREQPRRVCSSPTPTRSRRTRTKRRSSPG